MNYYITRAYGKIHKGEDSRNFTCVQSGPHRNIRGRIVDDKWFNEAGEKDFCKRCFPNGRPK